jgi:hypothetical protein
MPRLFAQKDPPPRGIGLFVDKIVPAAKIDLSAMRHYPGRGLIVADRPLFVTGKASFPITIASSDDIYISNINRDAPDAPAVGILSGGVVWVENSDQQTNISWHVHVHSGADRIYTTSSRRPLSQYDSSFAQANAILVGSVHLEGRIRNMAVDYPNRLSDRDARLFSEEPFFSVQYRHDPAFLDARNLPPGIVPLIRISRWSR